MTRKCWCQTCDPPCNKDADGQDLNGNDRCAYCLANTHRDPSFLSATTLAKRRGIK